MFKTFALFSEEGDISNFPIPVQSDREERYKDKKNQVVVIVAFHVEDIPLFHFMNSSLVFNFTWTFGIDLKGMDLFHDITKNQINQLMSLD